MGKPTKQVIFVAPEGFNEMLPSQQANTVAVWLAANPNATITPTGIAEGGLPPYLRRDTGKRADINRLLASRIKVAEFIPQARKLGGGYTDLVAALVGGYSRSSAGYGKGVIELVA
tara:strand:- start:111 stop:458 length:348 start_codon:yes stop_codon:yes gene_type:complete